MIKLTGVIKRFEAEREWVAAVDDLTLAVEAESFFTLLGPSGCGKSTLLRCVAGLETPDSGEIEIGGRIVFSSRSGVNVPPNKRRIGMVFQSYAIWPHMTVFENVAFPLEVQGLTEVRERTAKALAMVELQQLGGRYASRLSGGQQQRVAFARAIVAEPDVLLLDEPLSNLDAALRQQMAVELRKLHERLRITTLYVTHDQAEALALSDQIALISRGRIVEVGSPEELYSRPRILFTAQFLGGANILTGTASRAEGEAGGTTVATAFGTLWSANIASGPVTVFIRPEDIHVLADELGADDREGKNVFACIVLSDRFIGDSRQLELLVAGGSGTVLRCKVRGRLQVKQGATVRVRVDPGDVTVLE